MKNEKIRDISHIHKRARQQEIVDMFGRFRDEADKGDIVGAVVVYLDKNGVFHYERDTFIHDIPAYMGYMDLVKMRMIARFDPQLCSIFAEGVDE